MPEESRKSKITLEVEAKGAQDAAKQLGGIKDTAKLLDKELAQIGRERQLEALVKNFSAVTKAGKDADKAVEELNKELTKLGASQNEIQGVARGIAQAGQGGGIGQALQTGGSELRKLPSVRIGGIGTDSIANIVRVGGALAKVGEQGAFVTKVTEALTPALGAQAAGTVALTAAALPFIAAIGAIGLAIKNFADEQTKQQEVITSLLDAQRSVRDQIAEGATSEDLQKQLDILIEKRKGEAEALAKNQAVYDASYNQQNQNNSVLTTGLGTLIATGQEMKALSGAEEGLSSDLNKGKELVQDYSYQIDELQKAITNNKTATNDMKAAEEELEKQRKKDAQEILARAQQAGQAVAAQQRDLKNTEEQNIARLASIEDEKKAIQAQIDVLTASGDTTETVTDQIAKLNTQLGSLGSESQFINDTALAISRQHDAEKKAKKDAEDAEKKAQQNAEKAAAAQDKYATSIQNANRTFKQAAQDITTKLGQALVDNTTDLYRDVDDIAQKYRRDTYDQDVKFYRDERDARIDQYRDLEDIQRDAQKDEKEAAATGDFKALFDARQRTQEAIQNNARQFDREEQDRERHQQDTRADLLQDAQRTRADRLTQYDRQNSDSRLAAERELAQAGLNRQRTRAIAAEGLSAELKQLQAYYQERNRLQAQANAASLQQMGSRNGGISGAGISGAGISGAGISGMGLFQQVVQR